MLGERNTAAIRNDSQSFKQTVNNNYYQWLPGDFSDNQIQNLLTFWLRQPSTIPLDVVADSGLGHDLTLVRGFNDCNPFGNPRYFSFYAFFVGLLWYHATCQDPVGLHKRLQEPTLGNPIPVRIGKQRISQDLANSLEEWSRVRELAGPDVMAKKPRIVELGAGYGRLAFVFLTAQPCRYVIVDIQPALSLAQWYLSQVFPELNTFGVREFSTYEEVAAEIEVADICFLTADQLLLLPPLFADISVSISSLHEMRYDQIATYKALLEQKTTTAIYFKQWLQWTNPVDGMTVGRGDFILNAPWQLVLDCLHPVHDQMVELGFLRR